MSTITCTLEQFKKMTAEFLQTLPSSDEDQIDNGLKCLGLAFLGMQDHQPTDVPIAITYLDYANKKACEKLYAIACSQR
jgi:hypothetical protein